MAKPIKTPHISIKKADLHGNKQIGQSDGWNLIAERSDSSHGQPAWSVNGPFAL
jgi:hypothetical protein